MSSLFENKHTSQPLVTPIRKKRQSNTSLADKKLEGEITENAQQGLCGCSTFP
jgi:hypothetical protein